MDMDYTRMCSSPSLMMMMAIVKRIMHIIQIIAPIVLLIWATIGFVYLMKDPDSDKKGLKKIFNKFIAALVVFIIPVMVNAVMQMIGMNSDISNCWMSAEGYSMVSSSYVPINDEEMKKIFIDSEKYEKGVLKSKGCGEKIARAAVELAGTASPDSFIKSPDGANYCAFNKSNDPRLAKYNTIHDSRVKCNGAYASCTQAAATVIDWVADPEINWMGPGAQLYYLQHSDKWEEVTKPAGEPWSKYLEPGDVGEAMWDASNGHSWIYVGNEIAREKFPNTDGYIYDGGYSSCKNPHINANPGLVDADTRFHYFRFVGDCSQAENTNVKDGYGGPSAYSC